MIKDSGGSLPQGLSREEVAERIRKGQVNGEQEVKTKSFGEILLTNIVTPFNILNLSLAILILLVRSPKNALFMGVIFCNALIGTIQEIRAKRLIDRLSLIAAPKARVIRDGRAQEIPVSELVLDDLMSLSAGRQICADSRVVSGSCEVNEALLTGESDPVRKVRGDLLLSGSFVTAGSCLAETVHVGEENYAAQITRQAKYLKRPSSEIMEGINQIIRFIGAIILPIGLLLFAKQYYSLDQTLQDAVVSTVAALVGMIPEGLVLLTSVVLAVSVLRLGRKRALVQELYSIEMLARVDVLCLDKTGTITEGTMQVDEIYPLGERSEAELREAMGLLVHGLADENPTAQALRNFCPQPISREPDQKVPFSSARKWSGVSFADRGSYVMGAGEFVLPDAGPEISGPTAAAAARGQRVLMLAWSRKPFSGQELPAGLEPVGLVFISDKLRPSAQKTLRYFAEQGVDLKVISGDHPQTVAQIAGRAGLAGAENYIDASTLSDETEVRAAAGRYTVFGRVTPEQKLWLVQEWKAQGHTVAMTGDGVNDVMALKESDCSIAMASGSDAARNVSQIVLLDSDFASMPDIVAEGRRSINNLQRSASLFLVKTMFSTIIGVLFLFLSDGYPLEPIQFTLISMMTIGIPSFFLALEPNQERIRGRFLINIIRKAIPGALTDVTNIILLMILANRYDFAPEEISTVAVLLIGYTGLLYLFKVCIPFTWSRTALYVAVCAGFTLSVLFLRSWFSLLPLSWRILKVTIPLMGIATGVLLLLLLLVEKVLVKRGKMEADPS